MSFLFEAELYFMVSVDTLDVFIHLHMDTWIAFKDLATVDNAAMNKSVQCLSESLFSILWNIYPETEWLAPMVILVTVLRGRPTALHRGCTIVYYHKQRASAKVLSYPHPHAIILCYLFIYLLNNNQTWTRQGGLQNLLPRSSTSHRRKERNCVHHAFSHTHQAGSFSKKEEMRTGWGKAWNVKLKGLEMSSQEWEELLLKIPVCSLKSLHLALM